LVKKNKMNLKILDCTLRDGGYYNNWKFSKSQILEYLKNIYQSNIDFVEIGFRFFQKNPDFGKLAFSEDNFIKTLRLKNKVKYSVMVNSADLVKDQKLILTKKIFLKKKKSKISTIRIAVNYSHIFDIVEHLNYLKTQGYQIIINLMQVHKVTESKLKDFLFFLKKENIKTFYFADSFGSLKPNDVKKICSNIKKYWNNEFGIHAHDNCGYALANTLEAFNNGATFLDCTIMGMGRGAGNTSTESLITELSNLGFKKYNTKPIYSLTDSFFKKLKQKYKWGSSIYYHLAAIKNIHPSYIQELLFDNRYKHDEIINIIFNLSKIKKIYSYNSEIITKLKLKPFKLKKTKLLKSWCIDRNIMILGQGKSVNSNYDQIFEIIKKNKCIVISLNINQYVENKFINFHVVSDVKRYSLDQHNYKDLNKIILPLNILEKFSYKKNKNFINYNLVIQNNTFKINEDGCILPNELAIGYAIAACKYGGAKKIYLAGFDGYDDNDELNIKLKNYFKFLVTKTKFKFNFLGKSLFK
tara:strand:- start:14454 stop:16031 length:1578 start_codon:yes stop_codon:yes gene_type:complete